MAKYVENMIDLIGRTPMYKFNNKDYDIPENVNIFGKLEHLNPGGSIKDRTVLYMIEQAELRGDITPGKTTILEATAGNTGIALALIGALKGYKVILAVPGKFSIEKQILMRALGAELYNTPTKEDMYGEHGAYAKLKEIAETMEDTHILGQFSCQDNPDAHYYLTGPEIYDDMNGEIDVFMYGAGTGGGFCGISKYLKERNPRIKCVLSEPKGSIYGGGEYAPYRIEGIGNGFIPDTMDLTLADDSMYVGDDESYEMVKRIAQKSGLFVASSSGAHLVSAIEYGKKLAAEHPEKTFNIVTIMADRSERYFSKDIYDMSEHYTVSMKLAKEEIL